MAHKILIVEDDIDDQVLFIETIGSIDPFIECTTVGNGAEALDHLKHTNTLPSLILLDLNMPLMNGYDFLEKINKMDEFFEIPVVIFSTSTSTKDKERTIKLGAKSFFTKSNNIKDLRSNLVSVLYAKTY
jgi:CheY-like chemotaxis protein